uniref:Uncharacterized protein n=1 Tax=Vespula pensylvanica TaxID=30213 RepID=A0A834NQA1_VESPE|nr:hypothetical protein H0235_012170 [Vespula pensylvanica]
MATDDGTCADFNFDKPFSLHDRWPAAERAVAPIRSATVENGISEGQVVERAPYENLESPLNDKTKYDMGMSMEGQAPQARPSKRDFIHDPEAHPRLCASSRSCEGKRYIATRKG